jgi:DNA-binding transcriptional MerR regulator
LLSTAEVSELTGIPVETLRYWRHLRRRGPVSFKLGRRVVYERGDVQAWLDQQRKLTSAGGGDAA